MPIEDIITDCEILSSAEQVIAHGMGSCSRSERTIQNRNLNSTIKRACKRARVDAVKRLPSVSALFEDESFWMHIEAEHAKGRQNGLDQRNRQPQQQNFNTGARLEVMPIGKKLKGQRFDDMDQGALEYILNNLSDKPDIWNAAKQAYDDRFGSPDVAEGPAAGKTAAPETQDGDLAQPTRDFLDEYDDFAGSEQNEPVSDHD
ncbi:MAG: hypothetical protein MJA83_20085, partial [Gammaproteobacteria bacterium]|nr:hypothetical protein [Gammaproteobacteria bacterium]